MVTPAATAARIAREPEWWNVPSPRFCTKCRSSVNGASPNHCAPSPPICVSPSWCPRPAPSSGVVAADDARHVGTAVESRLEVVLQERDLVLDDEYLVQAGGELGEHGRVHRERHGEGDDPPAERLHGRPLEAGGVRGA